MTGTPYYSLPDYPMPADGAYPYPPGDAQSLGPVLMAVDGPAAQRRATVAIRLILAIPHLVALFAVGIGAGAVVIIGWPGAVVTGRLPRFAASYLYGYLRWYSRVGGYLLLLTDEYPPFTFGDADYPVRLAAGPGELNRLTVLLRIILAIPAAIVSMLVTCGLAVIVIVAGWPAALVAGRLPAPLHQAFAAVLRYTVRYYGYRYLLVGAYPAGLSGDQPGTQAAAPPWPGPGYEQGASWQLALSAGARRLVGLMLVLGLLTAAGAGAWAGAAISAARERARVRAMEISQLDIAVARFNAAVARHNAEVTTQQLTASQATTATEVLSSANDTLNRALNHSNAVSDNCATVYCFDQSDGPAAEAFAAFGRTLRATAVPPGSAAIDKRLAADNAEDGQDWKEMGRAGSFTSAIDLATAAEKVGARWDSDYQALTTSLSNELTTLGSQAVTLTAAATTLSQQGAALDRRAEALGVTISLRTPSAVS